MMCDIGVVIKITPFQGTNALQFLNYIMEIPRVSSYSQKHMPKTDFTVYMKVHYKIKEFFFPKKNDPSKYMSL